MTATPDHPNRRLFISLPVSDPEASRQFFRALGFTFDPAFEDGTGVCMLVGEQAYCMLLTHERFAEFSKLPMADPTTHALALLCFSVESREEVDAVADAAVAAGARDHDDRQDHGFMYSRSFFDLDGHGWQVMWMDPAAVDPSAEEPSAASAAGGTA